MTAASRAAFQTGLTALAQFLAREGHALVPGRHVERVAGRDHRLGVWVNSRRQDFKTGWLSDERVAALEAVPGWTWNPQEAAFQTGLAALAQFTAREGHALVPKSHVERFDGRDYQLGSWVHYRRTGYKADRLPAGRITTLEAVPGWIWGVSHEEAFQIGLAALQQFVDREGHALVPQTCVERVDGRDYRLGAWVNVRRVYYRKGWLSDERVAVLNAIPEWVWSVYGGVEADWRGDPPGEEGRDE